MNINVKSFKSSTIFMVASLFKFLYEFDVVSIKFLLKIVILGPFGLTIKIGILDNNSFYTNQHI